MQCRLPGGIGWNGTINLMGASKPAIAAACDSQSSPERPTQRSPTLCSSQDNIFLSPQYLNEKAGARRLPSFCCNIPFLVAEIEQLFDLRLEIVSSGNSANLPWLMEEGCIPGRINQLRIGEGILLGRETLHRSALPGTFQDAFVLEDELIEVKTKPSVPDGEIAQNVCGETPVSEDRGLMQRGILALGIQDVPFNGLTPEDTDIQILGGSSDHTIVALPESGYRVGDILRFAIDYGALIRLFTSDYVQKESI